MESVELLTHELELQPSLWINLETPINWKLLRFLNNTLLLGSSPQSGQEDLGPDTVYRLMLLEILERLGSDSRDWLAFIGRLQSQTTKCLWQSSLSSVLGIKVSGEDGFAYWYPCCIGLCCSYIIVGAQSLRWPSMLFLFCHLYNITVSDVHITHGQRF